MNISEKGFKIYSNFIKNLIQYLFKGYKPMLKMFKTLIVNQFAKIKIVQNNELNIFVFGLPHAGKSTMTAALVKFLDTDKNYILRRNPIKNKEGVLVFREWVERFNNGYFPLQTTQNEYKKLNLEYQKFRECKNIKKIMLYEIAGEDVIKFDPTHDDNDNIPPKLGLFFKKK
jgi:hypothetical protein